MAIVSTPLVDHVLTEDSEPFHPAVADPRLELVSRITGTSPFQKAIKLQALLRYIVDQSLRNDQKEITEHRIGIEVFGKGRDYSPLLDSSVRVHVRQLRLKLHEYFAGAGRTEPIILEIPKGSYRPVFRNLIGEAEPVPEPTLIHLEEVAKIHEPEIMPVAASSTRIPLLIASASALMTILLFAVYLWQAHPSVPWPLALVMNRGDVSHLILADSAYQITATANSRSIDLSEYLRTKPRNNTAINPNEPADLRLAHALAGGTFTSFADVVMLNSLARAGGKYKVDLDVKSARDLDPRDLENGNFILVGSPSSDPWVSLYDSKLSFREESDPSRPGAKMFRNVHPQGSEPKFFAGSSSEDAVLTDYADLAVVPGLGEHGRVMIVQGLRHEATEAAARMLSDPAAGRMLDDALRSAGDSDHPAFFEALLSVRAVAGIPEVTGVAAIRAPYK